MTDRYFAVELSKELGVTIGEAENILDKLELVLKQKMYTQTTTIHFLDLLFKNVTVKGSNCMNPQTKEIIYTPPYKKLRVALSLDWKQFLNGEPIQMKEDFLIKGTKGNVPLDEAVDDF